MDIEKKEFTAPLCEVICLNIQDVIATSGDDDWGMGEV